MEKMEINVAGKRIYLYGEREQAVPLVIVNAFEGDGENLYHKIKEQGNKDVCLGVVSGLIWNDEMTPWQCEPLYKNDDPCKGEAGRYLKELTEQIIPEVKKKLANEPTELIIAGYSLGGLFAIYSLYHTDLFAKAVSASGSLWFPEFASYVQKTKLKKMPQRVYFSLGDKEELTKNKMLRCVKEKTLEIYNYFTGIGIETEFQFNPGNHFKDTDERLAKGIYRVL
ncbi:MAG: alpha/beta hydrolase [Lachnospiraceae bacterium]|nr:alpha/beta hydrolase [Lachnospiraceae bacterium]